MRTLANGEACDVSMLFRHDSHEQGFVDELVECILNNVDGWEYKLDLIHKQVKLDLRETPEVNDIEVPEDFKGFGQDAFKVRLGLLGLLKSCGVRAKEWTKLPNNSSS